MNVSREQQIFELRAAPLGVLIIGGGINGAGVLRDMALRAEHSSSKLRAGLVEKQHFAAGASGKNSQLIHGGLRYLKYLQFHLVRESLRERAILLKIAPQFVKPQPFLLPMYGIQSRVVYGTGLSLYDLLAGRHAIARHQTVTASELAEIEPELSRDGLSAAALFYDCAIPSARFVLENILDGVTRGALAANYVRADAWQRNLTGGWRVRCTDALSGDQFEVAARKLVDARGPWSDPESLRLDRGSHIVIPRVTQSENAIAHFEPNGRIVFLIPWGSQRQLTLVGTTDEDHRLGPDNVHISEKETRYLLGVVAKLFPHHRDIAPVSAFSSLRPLVRVSGRSAASVSRDHRIWNSADGVLRIAGGKYTTYRLMSEQAADLVCREIAPELEPLHLTAETAFAPADHEIGDAMEQRLSDYLRVSTYLGYEQQWSAEALLSFAQALGQKRGWSEARIRAEVDEVVGNEALSAANPRT